MISLLAVGSGNDELFRSWPLNRTARTPTTQLPPSSKKVAALSLSSARPLHWDHVHASMIGVTAPIPTPPLCALLALSRRPRTPPFARLRNAGFRIEDRRFSRISMALPLDSSASSPEAIGQHLLDRFYVFESLFPMNEFCSCLHLIWVLVLFCCFWYAGRVLGSNGGRSSQFLLVRNGLRHSEIVLGLGSVDFCFSFCVHWVSWEEPSSSF